MTHSRETELQTLENLWRTTGVDAQQRRRLDSLRNAKALEIAALASSLNRWAHKVSTAV
jgi:hypothetical protein